MGRQRSRSGRVGRGGRRPGATGESTPPRLNLELARTWLVTVINPILEGLRREKAFLARGNWTWRHYTGRPEHFWPAEAYVPAPYRDNFVAFLEAYSDETKALRRHDAKIEELASRCGATSQRLLKSQAFLAAVRAAEATALEKGIDLNEARGAVLAANWERLLAEYVINQVRALPEHFTTATFWKEASGALLALRESSELRADFDAVDRAGTALLVATEQAERALRAIRNDYLHEFGLPPVPLPIPS